MINATVKILSGQDQDKRSANRNGAVSRGGVSIVGRPARIVQAETQALAAVAPPLVYTQNHASPLPSETPLFRRIERFSLQTVSASIMRNERVCKCLRNPVGNQVDIKHNKLKDSYGYRNLETCASVWMCPVCAAKISEKRRVELAEGVSRWNDQGGSVLLLTLTVQHHKRDSYRKSLDGLCNAYRKMLNRVAGKNTMTLLGVAGRIRALEVTYGANGWHPHFHVLLFVKSPFEKNMLAMIEESLLDQWKSVCNSVGLNTPNTHGCSLRDGSYASQYASKWGLESEVTKGHTKKSKTGYGPFDLLRHVLGTYQGEADPLAPGQDRILFKEYSYGMKGKRQLVWSDGLRDLLGCRPEKSDQELVDEVDEQEILFASIPLEMWKVILKAEKRAEVLESCRLGLDHFYLTCKKLWLEREQVQT